MFIICGFGTEKSTIAMLLNAALCDIGFNNISVNLLDGREFFNPEKMKYLIDNNLKITINEVQSRRQSGDTK
jgi:hypothetical protein